MEKPTMARNRRTPESRERQEDELAYRWEVDDEIQIYHSRPAKRYMICSAGGFLVSLQLLKDGSVAAIERGGDFWVGERGRIEFVRSTDGGESWTQPRPIVNMRPDPCHWSLGQNAEGTFLVSFVQPHNYKNGVWDTDGYRFSPVFLVRSSDYGRTWTQPAVIDTSSIRADQFNPSGRMVQLPDGTILMPLYTGSRDAEGRGPTFTGLGKFGCYILRSRDEGRTWGDASPIVEQGYTGSSLLYLPSGKLIATLTRKDGGHGGYQVESYDLGYTWSKPTQITGPDEGPGGLLLLRDGRVLVSISYRRIPYGIRAMISHDEGKTWDQERKIILSAESTYQVCGGGSSVQLADGKILTSYWIYQSAGPFRHPLPYWVGTGELRGPYAAAIKYDPADLP